MSTRGRGRNWRLEAVAWIAAIALVAAALAFSAGSNDGSDSPSPDTGEASTPATESTIQP